MSQDRRRLQIREKGDEVENLKRVGAQGDLMRPSSS
jgi:hypothetical protein